MKQQPAQFALFDIPIPDAPGGPRPSATAPAPVFKGGASLAEDMGLVHSRRGEHEQERLCLLFALYDWLDTLGGHNAHTEPGAPPRAAALIDAQLTRIQQCPDCPGAAMCKSWQVRKACLEVRAARDAALQPGTAWPLRTCYIMRFLRTRFTPAFEIRKRLEAGEVVEIDGKRFEPVAGQPVFVLFER